MKLFTRLAAIFGLAALIALPTALPSAAQTYPFQTPTYQPAAQLAAQTFTATGAYYFNANGAGASVRISALTGTLVAVIQGSNDPVSVANASASWTTLYYLDAASPSTAPANSITANGLYVFNTGGFSRFRVNITTLTGTPKTVTVGAALTAGPSAVYVLNPGLGTSSNTIGNVNQVSDYPVGAVPVTASATGTTGAVVGTLASGASVTTYICGFSITTSATAATVVAPVVGGTITDDLTFSQYVPANTAGVSELRETFSKCVPASAANTAITVTSGAAGAGGVTAVNAWGYQL